MPGLTLARSLVEMNCQWLPMQLCLEGDYHCCCAGEVRGVSHCWTSRRAGLKDRGQMAEGRTNGAGKRGRDRGQKAGHSPAG